MVNEKLTIKKNKENKNQTNQEYPEEDSFIESDDDGYYDYLNSTIDNEEDYVNSDDEIFFVDDIISDESENESDESYDNESDCSFEDDDLKLYNPHENEEAKKTDDDTNM